MAEFLVIVHGDDSSKKIIITSETIVLMEKDTEIQKFRYQYDANDYHIKKCETENIVDFSYINSTLDPQFKFNMHNNKFYTIIMIDPDAPSCTNPTNKYWLHWLVTNITKDNMKGTSIVDYNRPNPSVGSGAHRYYFVLFEHNNILNINKKLNIRSKFNLKDFLLQTGATSLNLVTYVRFLTERK